MFFFLQCLFDCFLLVEPAVVSGTGSGSRNNKSKVQSPKVKAKRTWADTKITLFNARPSPISYFKSTNSQPNICERMKISSKTYIVYYILKKSRYLKKLKVRCFKYEIFSVSHSLTLVLITYILIVSSPSLSCKPFYSLMVYQLRFRFLNIDVS